ncbi:MAG: VWA domain-containing protein, partial [Akkermansiaceae bacterium]|nr:VWA domain-containing protein [Verrucomicrobiales bacterium]
AVSSNPSTNSSILTADFVFIIDASSSMGGEIAAVKSGLGSFVTSLNTASIDARFAIVLFGGAPELILDWTTDQAVTEAGFDVISVSGAVPGVHNNHNLNPEAGLEAIRIVLNGAVNNTLQRNNVGGSGPLTFRPEARKNLVLVTDENCDLPFYVENRQAGQTSTEPPVPLNAAWQAEVNVTAQVVVSNNAFVNLLINPGATPSKNQYGDPAQSVSDANFLNFNPEATLTNLIAAGFGNSLEGQVLSAGLLGRAFNITSVDTTNFIQNFFAAKVEEIINSPPARPVLNIAHLPASIPTSANAVRLTWTTNAPGYLLETNRSLVFPGGWGVLTTNYSIINTNFAVTNIINDTLRFYRLRK